MNFGTNGWTGGQYSLFRAIFGTYLFIHFAQLAPWAAELFSNQGVLPNAHASPLARLFPNILVYLDSPPFVTVFVAAGAVFSILFIVGWHDRLASLLMYYIWACLFTRNPLISNPGIPYVGLLLLVHAFLPAAPYGSLAARNRPDPAGNWRMPQELFLVVWILMALGYTFSGYTKLISPSWIDGSAVARVLENPLARPIFLRDWLLALPPLLLKLFTWSALALELLFAPLALIRLLRPWLWLSMLLMHLGLMLLIDFADLSLGMIMLHLFTFNPAWIAPRSPGQRETVFYDGHCGLCHRAVRFILAGDTHRAFDFAPLHGPTFEKSLDPLQQSNLPDSIVLLTADNHLLTRSSALLHILHRLGGAWRILAIAASIFPRPLRDFLYDTLARIRHRIFSKPTDACPLIPPPLRERFHT